MPCCWLDHDTQQRVCLSPAAQQKLEAALVACPSSPDQDSGNQFGKWAKWGGWGKKDTKGKKGKGGKKGKWGKKGGKGESDRSWRGKGGKSKGGKNKAGKDKAGKNKAGKDKAGKNKAGKDKAGKNKWEEPDSESDGPVARLICIQEQLEFIDADWNANAAKVSIQCKRAKVILSGQYLSSSIVPCRSRPFTLALQCYLSQAKMGKSPAMSLLTNASAFLLG